MTAESHVGNYMKKHGVHGRLYLVQRIRREELLKF